MLFLLWIQRGECNLINDLNEKHAELSKGGANIILIVAMEKTRKAYG